MYHIRPIFSPSFQCLWQLHVQLFASAASNSLEVVRFCAAVTGWIFIIAGKAWIGFKEASFGYISFSS